MLSANDTAEKNGKLLKGVYLMTDIFGNQRKVKVVPAEKSVLIEMIDDAPKQKTNDNYNTFLYKKGSVRVKFGDISPLYCWSDSEFKIYANNGPEPLYFEKMA